MLRASLGALWIGTALVSFGLYPVQASYDLLARAGVPPELQGVALYGAATLDLVLGILTFVRRGRSWDFLPSSRFLTIFYLMVFRSA